jgi:D-sedoheptulose 7-phosphate isomerase
MNKLDLIKNSINESIKTKNKILDDKNILQSINLFSNKITKSILKGGKLLICGNGGSAADAQHLAAELLVRLRPHINRSSIPALSLATDTSSITACGNDFHFDEIYSRVIESLGQKNDILMCISTSGNSKNIINAIKVANKKGIETVCLTGGNGGKLKKLSKNLLIIPSKITARIQESHIMIGHIMMELIEDALLIENYARKI